MATFKNTIGTEFASYIKTQLSERAKITEKKNRDSKDLLWLTNRTGWYKVTSGALVDKQETLAKNNILQGGIVKDAGDGSVSLREGFNSSYLRNNELGFRPMPNISSISVGTGGRWQTLLQAEITIEAYDLTQLDIISRLYMSLGVHVFIEWGHTPYIDNSNGIQTTSIRPIDFFQYKGNGLTNGLLQKISEVKAKYDGNYEAFVGRVYNFDYNSNSDGSYTCKIKVMGAGAMADSLRSVSNLGGIDTDPTPDNDPKKYGSDLEVALTGIKNVLNNAATAEVTLKKVEGVTSKIPLGEILEVGTSRLFEGYTSGWGKIGNAIASISPFGIAGYYTKPSYGEVLNKIYGNTNYRSLSFTKTSGNAGAVTYTKRSNNFSKFGNASQIIHQIDGDKKYGLNPITTSFYAGYASTLTYEKTGTFSNDKVKATYITLGHLFCLVQHLGVFVIKTGEPQPAIYLDYHPDNTIVRTGTVQASIDPSVCLVPYQASVSLKSFLNPLDTDRKSTYDFQEQEKRSNDTKNFATHPQINRLNSELPSFNGKLFNILVNVDFAIDTLSNLKKSKSDKVATIREYLDSILAGINKSLGGINDFKLNFVDCSQTLRVVDQNYVPSTPQYLEMPVFGLKSIAYDYSFSSKISKELSSQIVIASQAAGTSLKSYPDDVLSYHELNDGVTDRFTPAISQPCIDKKTLTQEEISALIAQAQKNINEALRPPQALFDQLYNVFSLSSDEPISLGVSDTLVNYYNTLQIQKINISGGTSKEKILIPLELSITIDGIGGILPYTAFLLPDNRLPKRYRGRVAFIVFSINHIFENNQWLTELRGQTIIKP